MTYIDWKLELVGAFLLGLYLGLSYPHMKHLFQRYSTVHDIPDTCFSNQTTLRGVVVTVSDGDTFRIRHSPFFRGPGEYNGKLTENTLQIRLAGVDAPEMPHFGKECQPYAREAKAWLQSMLKDQTVSVQLLRRDQYGRAVCTVRIGAWPCQKNVSAEILKEGLARVYRLSGAEYGGCLDEFNALEQKAKQARIKVWSE